MTEVRHTIGGLFAIKEIHISSYMLVEVLCMYIDLIFYGFLRDITLRVLLGIHLAHFWTRKTTFVIVDCRRSCKVGCSGERNLSFTDWVLEYFKRVNLASCPLRFVEYLKGQFLLGIIQCSHVIKVAEYTYGVLLYTWGTKGVLIFELKILISSLFLYKCFKCGYSNLYWCKLLYLRILLLDSSLEGRL